MSNGEIFTSLKSQYFSTNRIGRVYEGILFVSKLQSFLWVSFLATIIYIFNGKTVPRRLNGMSSWLQQTEGVTHSTSAPAVQWELSVLGCWAKPFFKETLKVMSSAWVSGSFHVTWCANSLQIKDSFPVLPLLKTVHMGSKFGVWFLKSLSNLSFTNSSTGILFDIIRLIVRFPILSEKLRD